MKLNICQNAGFEAIEFLVTTNTNDWWKMDEAATKMGISTTYHQSWSLEENPTHLANKVLDKMGILPKYDYSLGDLFCGVPDGRPIVVYADRVSDFSDTHHNRRYQTVSVFHGVKYKLPWDAWVKVVRQDSMKVVFDTQHVLEYQLNLTGVEGLATYTKENFLWFLKDAWTKLGGSRNIEEVHWNDCRPILGHTAGRNVPLGSGVLPLREFAEFIRKDGFDGLVIPEVKPFDLLWRTPPSKLRKLVESYF